MTIKSGNPMAFVTDRFYVVFVSPGWLLVGRVADQDAEYLLFEDTIYIENVAPGVATLAIGLHAIVDSGVVTNSYALPDGMLFRRDAVSMAAPCDGDISSLIGKRGRGRDRRASDACQKY